ncbi:hypothetical protein GJ496_006800 [Pomphorhynchus laevis]|nr:hypothetical protein GJ496_006800 [Pomphorhynchus laevis]
MERVPANMQFFVKIRVFSHTWIFDNINRRIKTASLCNSKNNATRHPMLNDTDMHIPNRLLCSQLIFRHGSRTPLYVLPQKHKDVHHNACTHSKYGYNQDFYGKELFYPFPASETVKLQLIKEKQAATRSQRDYFTSVGIDPDVRLKGGAEFGALTTLGRKQLYALGQKIYDMHKSCGNVLESFKNVQAHSSYVTRTLDSVQSFLSGMLSRFSIVDYEANSYPDNIKVPVRVESFDHDFIFPNFIATPVLHRDILELYDKLPSDHELKQIRYKFLKEYERTMKKLNELFPLYGEKLHDDNVYRYFRNLINARKRSVGSKQVNKMMLGKEGDISSSIDYFKYVLFLPRVQTIPLNFLRCLIVMPDHLHYFIEKSSELPEILQFFDIFIH